MRYLVACLVIASTTANAAPAAKMNKKVADPKVCISLSSDYENASKQLAMIQAEGAVDNSAPRATMREGQSGNILNQARMTMDLLKNNGCKGPTAAPSPKPYLDAALDCLLARTSRMADAAWARMDGKPAPASDALAQCDQTKWVAK